jgi:signal transduction histidine kinase
MPFKPVKFWYRWNLGRRSVVITLVPLLVAAIVLVVINKALAFSREAEDELQRGLRVLGQIHAVHAGLAEAASGVRGYLLTQDEAFLAPYQRAEKRLRESISQLKSNVQDPVQRQSLAEISALVDVKLSNLASLLSPSQTPSTGSILEYSLDNKVLLDHLRDRIADMETRENQIVETLQQALQKARQTSRWLMFSTLVAAFVLATLLAQWFARDLITRVRRIRDNAMHIGSGIPLTLHDGGYQDEVAELDQLIARTSVVLDEKLEELRCAKASAEESNLAKTEFLSRTSHELRTPLNAIIGFSDLLSDGASASQQRHRVATIRRSAHHLLHLVNDLLDLSRLETGNLTLEVQPVAVQEIVITARDIVAGRAAAKSVDLCIRSNSADIVAAADSERFLQILLNLLDNAIKFTPAGTQVIVSWQAAMRAQTKGVEITVIDHGMGITPGMEQHLFSPFNRLDSQVEGIGLGMAISHSLAQLMGGHLAYQPAPGAGSCFVLWLPVFDSTSKVSVAKASAASARQATAAPPRQPANSGKATIPWVLVTKNPELLVLVETLAARFQVHCNAVSSPSDWQTVPLGEAVLLLSDSPQEQLQLPPGLIIGRALYITPEPPTGHDQTTVFWLTPPPTALGLRRLLQELING